MCKDQGRIFTLFFLPFPSHEVLPLPLQKHAPPLDGKQKGSPHPSSSSPFLPGWRNRNPCLKVMKFFYCFRSRKEKVRVKTKWMSQEKRLLPLPFLCPYHSPLPPSHLFSLLPRRSVMRLTLQDPSTLRILSIRILIRILITSSATYTRTPAGGTSTAAGDRVVFTIHLLHHPLPRLGVQEKRNGERKKRLIPKVFFFKRRKSGQKQKKRKCWRGSWKNLRIRKSLRENSFVSRRWEDTLGGGGTEGRGTFPRLPTPTCLSY